MGTTDRQGNLHDPKGRFAEKSRSASTAVLAAASSNDIAEGWAVNTDGTSGPAAIAITDEVHEALDGRRMVAFKGDSPALSPFRPNPFDEVEITDSEQPGRAAVTARVDVGYDLMASVASTYGNGADEDDDAQIALEWLNEHHDDLDRVLTEDYGARLDPDRDEWDGVALLVERSVPVDHGVGQAIDTVTDTRSQGLYDLASTMDYAPLLAEAEKHARDRQRTVDLAAGTLDHLTNTVGNDVAERARYLTMATRWASGPGGESVPVIDVTAFDSNAQRLGEPRSIVYSGDVRLERNRVPSDLVVVASDPMEPRLLNAAQNATSTIDLDRAASLGRWGKAKP